MASQQHLDRLSAVDAGFLAQEKPNTHMHIGGLALFVGEPPGLDEFLAHIQSRLHRTAASRSCAQGSTS